jgi:hypothetical protein
MVELPEMKKPKHKIWNSFSFLARGNAMRTKKKYDSKIVNVLLQLPSSNLVDGNQQFSYLRHSVDL